MRMPYSPSVSVVPLREPPDGMGTRPLCAFRYFVRRGASCAACRQWPSRDGVGVGRGDVPADRIDSRAKLERRDPSMERLVGGEEVVRADSP